jgi:short-subunit dehydrogenase
MSPPFPERYGPLALVTGAANGIGRGFAEGIARRGLSLLLVDYDVEALEATAKALRESHDVAVETLVADLTSLQELDRVCEVGLSQEVGLLVNNAGRGTQGPFLSIDLEDHLGVLDVNTRAPLVLSHRLIPAMCERGRGGVIFTASMASFLGAPYVGHYAATKAYDKSLAEALYGELHTQGIDVVALCPGLTRTKSVTAGMSEAEARALPAMDRGPVAEVALAALGRRPWVVPGFQNRLRAMALRFLPRGIVLRKMGSRLRSYK